MSRTTLGLFGCGTLAGIIADGLVTDLRDRYEVIGVCDIDTDAASRMAQKVSSRCCAGIDELLGLKPQMIIEAASAQVLRENAVKILEAGSDLLPLSVGAFADTEFFSEVEQAAIRCGRTVNIPSGAIGGFDLMGAGMAAGDLSAEILMEKPPRALVNSPAFKGTADDTEPMDVFEGTSAEAIKEFPKNVNVAVALGLATLGPDLTRVRVRSNPALSRNRHTVTLDGRFGSAKIVIEAAPSSNPSSSALAAYSVLALLKRLASPVKIG
ncbi:MAG: DUF108 domain-containing protein [Oscillospiraceae bacterium]|nr:DUF108 domain-containing protein [Oscillospiraceae bacterium]